MIWVVKPCVFVITAFCSYVPSCMYDLIPGLSLVRGSHRVVLHVQLNVRDGTVLSCGCHCWLPSLMSVRWLVCELGLSRLASWWAIALCLVILRERERDYFGIMCNWDWCVCMAKRGFSMVAHVLGKSKYEGLPYLLGFWEVVRKFVVDFLVGEPFFCM